MQVRRNDSDTLDINYSFEKFCKKKKKKKKPQRHEAVTVRGYGINKKTF